jgi:PAS domain S-box-containing protein
MDAVPVGVYTCGKNGQINFFNDAAVALWGRRPRIKDPFDLYCGSLRLFHPSGAPMPHDTCPMAVVLKSGTEQRNKEIVVERPDGSKATVLVNAVALFGGRGEITGAINCLQDITARKEAEKEIRYQASLIENVNDAIVATDAEFNIRAWNRAAEKMYGWKAEEVMGRPSAGVFGTKLTELERNNVLSQVENTGGYRGEYTQQRKDGSLIQVEMAAIALLDENGAIKGFAAVNRDVTQDNRALDELRASERRFRDVFDKSSVGMVMKSIDGGFVAANEAYCKITGYSRAELLLTDYYSITHPDDRERNQALMKKMLKGVIPFFVLEKRYLRKDGPIVWVRNSVSLLRDYRGIPERFVVLTEDITERKRAMEGLQALTARLEWIREEERSEIAQEIHDDVGQTLTALSMDLSAIGKSLTGKTKDTLQAAKRIRAMNKFIETAVRSVRRIAAKLRPEILARLEFPDAIRWLGKDFSKRSDIKMSVAIKGRVPKLRPDVSLAMFRIVQEALTNIVRHSNAREARIVLNRKKAAIRLEVRDNGKGFEDKAAHESPSLGILGMSERARFIGADFAIRRLGHWTVITVELPLEKGDQ